jgi:membrane associated rhomboid family serine protease
MEQPPNRLDDSPAGRCHSFPRDTIIRMSPRGTSMLSFPPFRGFVRVIVLACVILYFATLLLPHNLSNSITQLLWLLPLAVMHGWIWQLITYSFLHGSVTHIVFNMLSLWLVGAYLEQLVGTRKVTELYFISVLGGSLATLALAYLHWFGVTPLTPTVGASAGIFGLMVGFAVLFGDMEFIMFPLPIRVRAKYLVLIYIIIALAGLLGTGREGIAYIAHLGGALAGYIYLKLSPRKGYATASTEWWYGMRNAWYRNKRKRAAKKFQVYMRDQDSRLPDRNDDSRPN